MGESMGLCALCFAFASVPEVSEPSHYLHFSRSLDADGRFRRSRHRARSFRTVQALSCAHYRSHAGNASLLFDDRSFTHTQTRQTIRRLFGLMGNLTDLGGSGDDIGHFSPYWTSPLSLRIRLCKIGP